jgi:hypothetical protein
VTRNAQSLPQGCGARRQAAFLVRFFDAFNRGDRSALDELLAPEGSSVDSFKLVSWQGNVVAERGQALRYFDVLRTEGETFRLLGVEVSPTTVRSSAAMELAFARAAGTGVGKALVTCDPMRIWMLALAPAPTSVRFPCPVPPGWSASGPAVACTAGPNARALAPTFRLGRASAMLPTRCRPASVERRVSAALAAFDAGQGPRFAAQFTRAGSLRAYTSMRVPARGRSIARFVSERYAAGDGWTALALAPPKSGAAPSAVYGLTLQVRSPGAPVARAGAKLLVDCGSGLLRGWVGPAIEAPGQ